MGGEVTRLVALADDMELIGIVERQGHPIMGWEMDGADVTDNLEPLISQSNVIVEFTSPDSLEKILDELEGTTVPMVSGTTGLSSSQLARLKTEGKNRAVLWSPNMSAGVNTLFNLVAQATRALPDYDVEIVEMHHRYKKDAPSGTAAKIAEIVSANRDISEVIHGRKGHTGERERDQLGIHALRGGDVAGEHTVYFLTDGERIELTHRASSRLALARGALMAIRFLAFKPPGFYQYSDILEDK
jgi:4-hydroxy-tetrahydrodipicolinate reductase